MRFILVRHCQTNWNLQKRITGQTDIPLNLFGESQAREVGERLRIFSISRIVTSDLQRCVKTATLISERLAPASLSAPIHLDKRLRETSAGRLEGLNWKEIERHFGINREQIFTKQGFFDFTPYGGQSSGEVVRRQLALFKELAYTYRWDTILLVGHSSSFGALLTYLKMNNEIIQGGFRMLEYGI